MNTSKIVVTMILLWLSHFLVDFMIGIWAIYKTIAGLDIAIMGAIAGISVFIGEAFQLYFGNLSDKGFRKLLIISGMLTTCCCSLVSYTENYPILFLLFFLTTLGSGAFHPSAAGLVGSLSKTRKGLLITIFAMGGALGFALSQIVFSNLYVILNGQTVLLIIPSCLLGLMLAFYPLMESKMSISSKKLVTFNSILGLFKREHLSCLYFTQVSNGIIAWGTIFLLPDILISRGYESWICFGGGHLFFILGGAFLMVPAGFIADKFSYKNVIITSSIFGMIFFYTFLKFPFISNGSLLVLLFLMGASIMTINPLIIAFGNKLYPKEPGAISGFLMGFAWCIASLIGQAGGGLLTKMFTEDVGAKALSFLCIFFSIGLFLSLFLPGRKAVELKTAEYIT